MTGIKTIRNAALMALVMIGSSVVLMEVNWELVISASILASIVSILWGVVGFPDDF